MFYACAIRFDVTENLENFLVLGPRSKGEGAADRLPPMHVDETRQGDADE